MPQRANNVSPLDSALMRSQHPDMLERMLELLTPGQEMVDVGDPQLPRVPKPPTPASPLAVGQDTALLAELFYQLVPHLRGTTVGIQRGPTRGSRLASSRADPPRSIDSLGDPLLGVFDHLSTEIHVSPNDRNADLLETLAHEFSHATGRGEPEAYEAGQLARHLLAREAETIQRARIGEQ
jgi:hypothetical protein